MPGGGDLEHMQHLPLVALPGEQPSPQTPSRPQSGTGGGGPLRGYSRQWGSEAGGPVTAGEAVDAAQGVGDSSGGGGIGAEPEELAPRASWGLSILSDSQRRIPLAARPPVLGAGAVSARSRQPSSSSGDGSIAAAAAAAAAAAQAAGACIPSRGPSPGRAALYPSPSPQPCEPPAVTAPGATAVSASSAAVGASLLSSSGNPMSTPSQQSVAVSTPPRNTPAGLRGAAYAVAPPPAQMPLQLQAPVRPPMAWAAENRGIPHAAGPGPSAVFGGSHETITSNDVSVSASASAVASGSSGHSSARYLNPQLPMPPTLQPPPLPPRHPQPLPGAAQGQAQPLPHTPLPPQLAPACAAASTPPGSGTPASATSPSSWGDSSAPSPPSGNGPPTLTAPNAPSHPLAGGRPAGGTNYDAHSAGGVSGGGAAAGLEYALPAGYPGGDGGWYGEMLCAAGGRRPLLYGREWEGLVHEVTWRVARGFGFQAFNLNPDTRGSPSPQWTPATAFLAGDHLCRLLAHNLLPRMRPTTSQLRAAAEAAAAAAATSSALPPQPGLEAGAAAAEAAAAGAGRPRFALAVYELHTSIFHGYERGWCAHVGLPPRPREAARKLAAARWWDTGAVHGMLLELCLYFLLYSEAANLRHTPELLWFLFWAAAHSDTARALWRRGMPLLPPEAVAAPAPAAGPEAGLGQARGPGAGVAGEGLRERRVRLRNQLQVGRVYWSA